MAEAGRVVAGTARGIRLLAPGPGTRPLADRVKEAVFAILGPDLVDARFLDLFAGSGAAGIEALSRGAALAVFVERDAATARVIGENLRRAGLADRATLVRMDVLRFLGHAADAWDAADAGELDRTGTATGARWPFDVAFVDPPYAETGLRDAALALLGAPGEPGHAGGPGILVPGARVAATHFWRDAPPEAVGLLASERVRRFGETAVTFYRRRES
jgi:16S rRNA (guanine(966)-N(2))-methyltransferase RsmD